MQPAMVLYLNKYLRLVWSAPRRDKPKLNLMKVKMVVFRRRAWLAILLLSVFFDAHGLLAQTDKDFPVWAAPVIGGQALTAAERNVLSSLANAGEARTQTALANIRADIARELMAQGLHDEDAVLQKAALRYAASAADLDPSNPQRWVLLGAMYQAIEPVAPFAATEAEVAFLEALEIAPANPKALMGLIQFRWERERYAEVLDPLERLISELEEAAREPTLPAQLAVAYIQSRELQRGIEFFRSQGARNINPDQAKTLRAVLHGERHDESAERALLEEVANSGAEAYAKQAREMLEGLR